MKTDKASLIEMLCPMFESELALGDGGRSDMQFPAEMVVGREGDDIQLISIVLQGSIRAVRIDESGEEILIYNIEYNQESMNTDIYCNVIRIRHLEFKYCNYQRHAPLLTFKRTSEVNGWEVLQWRTFHNEV